MEDLTRFWVIEDSSDETAWKNTDIWSADTRSGKVAGISDTKFKNSLNNLGRSNTKDWSWTYIRGISQTNIAAPTIINTAKDRINAIDSETL